MSRRPGFAGLGLARRRPWPGRALFFLLPLVIMAVESLGQELAATPAGLDTRQLRPLLRQALLLRGSVQFAPGHGTRTVLSVLLAYPLAWILAYRVPARWQRVALMLAILPFWTSYLVRSYCWLLVLATKRRGPGLAAALGHRSRRPAGQQPHRDADRLRPLLRHAADAYDLCQPRADPGRPICEPPPISAPRPGRHSCA